MSEDIYTNKALFIEYVLNNDDYPLDCYAKASEAIRSDKMITMQVVSKNASLLKFASDELRSDKEVVLAAISNWAEAISYASDELKADKDVILAAIQSKNFSPQDTNLINPELFKDNDILEALIDAIKNYSLNYSYSALELSYMNEKLFENEEFKKQLLELAAIDYFEYPDFENFNFDAVINNEFFKEILIALRFSGEFHSSDYQYWDKRLFEDKDFILDLLYDDIDGAKVFEFIPNSLKNDKNFMMEALDKCLWAYEFASETLRNDKELSLIAVQAGGNIRYLGESLKYDKEIILEAVKLHENLEDIDISFRDDKEVIWAAATNDYRAYMYASERLKNDKEIFNAAMDTMVSFYKRVGKDIGRLNFEDRGNKELLYSLITEKTPQYFMFASNELQEDEAFRRRLGL